MVLGCATGFYPWIFSPVGEKDDLRVDRRVWGESKQYCAGYRTSDL